MIVADTSLVVGLLREGGSRFQDLQTIEEKEEVAITSITAFELLYPVYHGKLDDRGVVRALIGQTRVLPYDFAAADESARIQGMLKRIGKEVNVLDVMIAGCAVANGANRILTRDKDFLAIGKVTDLVVEVLGDA